MHPNDQFFLVILIGLFLQCSIQAILVTKLDRNQNKNANNTKYFKQLTCMCVEHSADETKRFV